VLIAVEIVSVLLTFVYLYYAEKLNPYAWLFGIMASCCSVYFFYQIGLWASLWLNIIYLVQGINGFVKWKFFLKQTNPLNKVTKKGHLFIVLGIVVLSILLYQVLLPFPSIKMNYFDLLLALGSITATFLEIQKEGSCWKYWIVFNLAYAILYISQSLYIYALLMLLLSMYSFRINQIWMRKLKLNKGS